jgi:hypothetical protein
MQVRTQMSLFLLLQSSLSLSQSQTPSPFEGSWKLNAAESQSKQLIPDAILTLRAVPEGLQFSFQRLTAEGKAAPRVATCHLDGKEHPLSIVDGKHQTHTSTCRLVNDNTLEQVIVHDQGKAVTRTRSVVSPDGRKLRESWSGHNDNGEKIDLVYSYNKQ